jgi:hypothetical protein
LYKYTENHKGGPYPMKVLIPTLAHIFTNFFAFSNLVVENWVR